MRFKMNFSLLFRSTNISQSLRLILLRNNKNNFSPNRTFTIVGSSANNHNIVSSTFEDIQFNGLTIPEYVYQNFGKHSNKIAMECSLTKRRYTYEELQRNSKNFAGTLQKKFHLNKGDVVALVLPNIPEFPICLLGALEAGLVVTTVNTSYTQGEISKQLIDSKSKLVITVGELWPIVQKAINESKIVMPAVVVKTTQSESLPNGTINFQECIDTKYDLEKLKGLHYDDLAILPYSSGTTGIAKGVELNTKNIVCNLKQMEAAFSPFSAPTTAAHQDTILCVLPWFHVYGMTVILLHHLFKLCKLISLPKFSANSYIQLLNSYQPNSLYVVPPMIALINSPIIKREQVKSVKVVVSGAAPLGSLDEQKLQEKINKDAVIVQGYGLTETSGAVMILSPSKKKKFNLVGSVGEPFPSTSMKITPADNPSGEALGYNECGELLIKGPSVTKSYYNKPEETKRAFVNGWFRTGDIAYYDFNHCFYITDRIKELIKVKGYQVAPAELEAILRAYPGVVNSAVIGVPHERYGEVPRAYIEQDKNANISVKKLEEYVASQVANFKQLKGGIAIINSIPVSPSGKLLRKQLKLLYDEEKHK